MAIIDEDKNKNGELIVNGNTIKGVNEETQAKATSSFGVSEKVTNAQNEQSSALSGYKDIVGKDSIVSQGTWDSINSSFKTPNSVKQADKWLSSQLQTIQSGKTSYSDQVRGMIDKIMGREKFSYDVDKDPLFQQALASSMSAGKQAMQDAIGQASALTGGYGSTYATSVGNQTYNSFIEDAYDNLPQYYNMALDAYNAEGDELYRQYGMLSAEDDKEFNRNVTAYDATYQHRNQMYNEAYSQFRDSKSDAFASANLQISEHGQLANDAYNLYNATSNYAESLYAQEFDKWNAEVNQAMQWAGLQNSDYWNQSNQDFTASENALDRTHQSNENALDRTHQSNENALDRTHQSNENALDRDLTKSENALDREHQSSENQKDRDLTTSENQKDREHQSSENAKDRSHDASESQKDREHQSAESAADREWRSEESQKDRDHDASESQKDRDHQDKWNQADQDYRYDALEQDQSQFDASLAEDKRQFDETMAYNKTKGSGSGGSGGSGGGGGGKSPTQTMMKDALKAYNEGGTAGLKTYLGSVPDEYDISGITDYVAEYGEAWVSDYDNYSGWEISNDTNNGWWVFGKGEDHNDVFSNGTESKTYDDLKKEINASNIPQEKKDELLKKLQNQSKK